jgi:hypothetical protein
VRFRANSVSSISIQHTGISFNTPVYPNEDVAQAEARLAAFTQAIVPVLNGYLPQ